jgi:hypothetical protein
VGTIPARPVRRAALALAVLALLAAPVTPAAAEGPDGPPTGPDGQPVQPDWYGWGAKIEIVAAKPVVTFVVYVGQDGPPATVLASKTTDISKTCVERGAGAITYRQSAAVFDGASYLRCRLPSWGVASADLGVALPGGGEYLTCPAGAAPTWGDHDVTLKGNVSGTFPLMHAPSVGISTNLVSNGTSARTRLQLARVLGVSVTTYRSPAWTIGGRDRGVLGLDGDGLVAVADHFHWLDYLVDQSWRSFFPGNVAGATVGSWLETPVQTTTTGARRYELGVNGGPLFVGFNPASGAHLRGTLRRGGIDPGCQGL